MLRISSRVVRRCSSAWLPPARRNFSSGYGDWVDAIDEEYLSMRGLAIVSRVFRGAPEFKGYIRGKPRVFVSGASDEARISMYVMSQFPMSTRVDLPEFVRGAERAASTVLHRLYAQDQSETKEFLEHLATSDSLKALLHKPSVSMEGGSKQGRAVLEQLDVNVAALEAVEYTWERVEEEVKAEWLTLRVQYDVTEHLLVLPEGGEGIEDRRAINTRFAWTFEADVTNPDGLEWGLVEATPFEEKPAVLTTNAAQTEEKE